ncbi:mitochondrial 54S ribosomal protein bL19m [Calcarisporiella thermophila]|uniref:mitochondrial 54S ribosomal protein bL19m n=1 Tax=Calcarisporiella thermophila TaxID=911321 RepID=UPI0037448537
MLKLGNILGLARRAPTLSRQVATASQASTKPSGNTMVTLQTRQIQSLDPTGARTALFHRSNPDRVLPGSVLVVESYLSLARNTTNSFVGILTSIRRKGVDTCFTLRNHILKTGVEVRFSLYSPLLKDIRVVQRAAKSRRAKLYYLRERGGKALQAAAGKKK